MDPQELIRQLLSGEGLNLDVQGQPRSADITGSLRIPIQPDVEAEIRGGMYGAPYQNSYSGRIGFTKRF